ncbi:MAG: 50S ribosomal protein L10 [Clostridia bacterium]|nr:50S ribosomal protein L10 [Clostridia bacterium]
MPSAKILEQKKAFVDGLADKFSRATSGVLVKYQGITVDEDTKLRAELRAAGVEYTVIKNRLIGLACDKVGFGDMRQHLTGMNAVAISYEDPIAPAKILKKYADKIETFEIRAGFIDGAVVDAAVVGELADIPPKEVLIARLMGSMQSPLYGLACGLQAIIDKSGEEAPAEEKPAEEAAPAEEAPAAEKAAPAEEAPAAEAEAAPAEEAPAAE